MCSIPCSMSSFQDGASAARAVRGRFASPVFEGWSHSPPHGARVVGGRPNGPSSGARIVRPTPSRRRAHRSFSLGRRERRFSGSSLAGGAPWPRRSRPRWPPSGHLPRGSSRGCRSLHDVRRSEATIKRGLLRRRSRPGWTCRPSGCSGGSERPLRKRFDPGGSGAFFSQIPSARSGTPRRRCCSSTTCSRRARPQPRVPEPCSLRGPCRSFW